MHYLYWTFLLLILFSNVTANDIQDRIDKKIKSLENKYPKSVYITGHGVGYSRNDSYSYAITDLKNSIVASIKSEFYDITIEKYSSGVFSKESFTFLKVKVESDLEEIAGLSKDYKSIDGKVLCFVYSKREEALQYFAYKISVLKDSLILISDILIFSVNKRAFFNALQNYKIYSDLWKRFNQYNLIYRTVAFPLSKEIAPIEFFSIDVATLAIKSIHKWLATMRLRCNNSHFCLKNNGFNNKMAIVYAETEVDSHWKTLSGVPIQVKILMGITGNIRYDERTKFDGSSKIDLDQLYLTRSTGKLQVGVDEKSITLLISTLGDEKAKSYTRGITKRAEIILNVFDQNSQLSPSNEVLIPSGTVYIENKPYSITSFYLSKKTITKDDVVQFYKRHRNQHHDLPKSYYDPAKMHEPATGLTFNQVMEIARDQSGRLPTWIEWKYVLDYIGSENFQPNSWEMCLPHDATDNENVFIVTYTGNKDNPFKYLKKKKNITIKNVGFRLLIKRIVEER